MDEKKISAAAVLIKTLEQLGVKHIFGHPGGAVIPIFDALYDSSIEFVLTRHEQGATHMADGYARATGNIAVVLVTSGPGATNTITGLLTAKMDSVPMIVISGQQTTDSLGLDAFQEADVLGISFPVVKHSYLVKDPNDVARIVKEAMFVTKFGRPGPVLIDMPKDVSSAMVVPNYDVKIDLPGIKKIPSPNDDDIEYVVNLLHNSARPLFLVGHGAIISGAALPLMRLVEKLAVPVVNTLLGKGAFPETHALSLGMLGMHGTAYANLAVASCDAIISIGSRWDDRILGDPAEFCKTARKVHIDVDAAEFDKIIKMDRCIHSDALIALNKIDALTHPKKNAEWISMIKQWKKKHPLKYKKSGALRTRHVIEEFYKQTKGNAIICTDVGQHQMWSAQYCLTNNPREWISSGGAGTMGFGLPAAIGAQIALPDKLVGVIVGDGGFQMTMPELATLAHKKLPIKILVINNGYLGMVKQWQGLFYNNRLSGVKLESSPDFVRIASAYKIKSIRLRHSAHVKRVIREMFSHKGPVLIDAEVCQTENVFPMIPAGESYQKMIINEPTEPLAKPKGSV